MRISHALLLASALSACGGGNSDPSATDVPFRTVAISQNSGINTKEGVVARSQREFNTAWTQYSANLTSPAQAPNIDFGVEQIIGFASGTRSSGCHTMSITRVSNTGDRLVVTYRENIAPPDTICTTSTVTPAHLIAVPASPLQVAFVPG